MTTFNRIWNSTSRAYGRVYGELSEFAIQQALADTAARRGDEVAIEEVEYEMVQQGERMINGSYNFEPRMVQTIKSYTTVRSGKVAKANSNGYTVKWQA